MTAAVAANTCASMRLYITTMTVHTKALPDTYSKMELWRELLAKVTSSLAMAKATPQVRTTFTPFKRAERCQGRIWLAKTNLTPPSIEQWALRTFPNRNVSVRVCVGCCHCSVSELTELPLPPSHITIIQYITHRTKDLHNRD